MVVNDYMDLVQQTRLFLLTVQANEETDETLTEMALLLKSDVTTHNVDRLGELLENLRRNTDAN